MARPNKQGVDYFSLDVHLDDKMKFVEIKYKLEGFAIVIKLMQRIYAQGYWCKWSEDEMLLFSDEIKADYSMVEDVTKECLKRGVFDNELYEKHNVLTSKGIQKRYKEIVRKRKDVQLTPEYLLIDGNFGVNGGINSINDGVKPEGGREEGDKSTQTKLKETKSKETNNTYSSSKDDLIQNEFDDFWSIYKKKADKKKAFEKFKVKRKKHSFDEIIEGVKKYMYKCDVENTDKQYIKGAAVFLNNDCFLEEHEVYEKASIGTHQKQNDIDWENL